MRTAAILLVLFLCACSSGGTKRSPAVQPVLTTVASASPVDPNIATCDAIRTIMLKLQSQMAHLHTAADLFDKTVATGLRDDATALFGQETTASGPVKDAIHAEATGLVNLSIAMEGEDATSLGSAADASNAALAQVRGTCKF